MQRLDRELKRLLLLERLTAVQVATLRRLEQETQRPLPELVRHLEQPIRVQTPEPVDLRRLMTPGRAERMVALPPVEKPPPATQQIAAELGLTHLSSSPPSSPS